MAQFNLDEYETVESRLKRYAKMYPDFRVKTKVLKYSENHILIQAWIYQNKEDQEKGLYHASGLAEEVRGEGFVNKTSHVENCETSAIGRSLANANWSGDKRPSREEMAKVSRLNAPESDLGDCPKCGKPLTTKMTKKGEAIVCSTGGWDSVNKKAFGCDYIKWPEEPDFINADIDRGDEVPDEVPDELPELQ